MSSKFIKNYLPELKTFVFGRSKPSMVTVNLTNQCNQNCIYCEIGKEHQIPDINALSYEDIIWILDEMEINNIKRISLCGGEPFLFKGIIDIVSYAHNKNIRCSITTNGMNIYLLNESELNILKESKTEINISIDSFKESVNSFLRGSSIALSNALKSIKKLNEKRIPLTVLTVISKYNYHELFNFVKLASDNKISQVLFQPIIYYSNYPERRPIDEKNKLNVEIEMLDILMNELSKILRFEKINNIKTNVYRIFPWIMFYLKTASSQDANMFFKKVLNKFYCREIYAIIDISYDGGIQPCGLVPASIFISNNKQRGLLELWSEATLNIKEDLKNEKYYSCCNGCCHHFSRNMLASIVKHPIKNRVALLKMMPLFISRIKSRMVKKILK